MKIFSTVFYFFLVLNILYCQNIGITTFNEDKPEFAVQSDYYSKYMWRGYAFSEASVFQPSAWVTYKNFTVSTWVNLDLKNEEHTLKCNEVDLLFSLYFEKGNFTFEPVIQLYFYPGMEDSPASGEITLKAGYFYHDFGLITTQNADIIAYNGAYYGDAAIEFEHSFSSKSVISCLVGFGWSNSKFNDAYIGVEKSGLMVSFLNFAYTHYLAKNTFIKPKIEISSVIGEELIQATGKQPVINFGLSLGHTF